MQETVVDLGAKLEVLRAYTDLTNQQIAKEIGVSARTIKWYIYGDSSREPGTIPLERYQKFLALLCTQLPGEPSEAEAETLLKGSVVRLRAAFETGKSARWPAFVQAQAKREELALKVRGDHIPERGPAVIEGRSENCLGSHPVLVFKFCCRFD
ncbi:MAG: hypothetical protein HWD60_03005 [Defluviicoccus sp.]|nr:MAG: hypothetical protein HWD60_03005 [Defluviicoccus sp.]